MNIFGWFKESSDVNDINKNGKHEINQSAQDKFEQIMGDTNLKETIPHSEGVDHSSEWRHWNII